MLEHEQPLCALRAIDCSDWHVVLDAIVTLQSRVSGGEVGNLEILMSLELFPYKLFRRGSARLISSTGHRVSSSRIKRR